MRAIQASHRDFDKNYFYDTNREKPVLLEPEVHQGSQATEERMAQPESQGPLAALVPQAALAPLAIQDWMAIRAFLGLLESKVTIA